MENLRYTVERFRKHFDYVLTYFGVVSGNLYKVGDLQMFQVAGFLLFFAVVE